MNCAKTGNDSKRLRLRRSLTPLDKIVKKALSQNSKEKKNNKDIDNIYTDNFISATDFKAPLHY